MPSMSMPVRGAAARIDGSPARARSVGRPTQLIARVSRSLWLRERGVAELRWAAITLWTMVALGFVAIVLDPAGGDFDALIVVATPTAALITFAGWGPFRTNLGREPVVRMGIGPLVMAVVVVGAGPTDLVTLAVPPAAPLVILAMAFAAMTRGYAIAASILIGASLAVLIAHWEVVGTAGIADEVSDQFVVGSLVTLLASAGMALMFRIATDAEARANRLAARDRKRAEALETLNRILARFDGSQPVKDVIQSIVGDIASEFDITLVSMYLPDGEGRLSMVGVAGYDSPFHVIETGVGVIGRTAATRQTQFVPDALGDPDYRAARADVRSEVAAPILHGDELLGIVNFEGAEDHPIGPAQVALAEMVCHEIAGALRSARLDDERRDRLHAIEQVLAVSRSLVADLDRTRIVTSIVDVAAELLSADVVGLISRGPDGIFRAEAGVGFPQEALGAEIPLGLGLSGRCMVEGTRQIGVQEASVWSAEHRAARPGGGAPHAGMALPIIVADEVAAVLLVSRVGAERRFTDLELGVADLLTAQIAIALQNADLHARVAESAVRDPLTGLLNRRYFDEAVETAYASAGRSGAPLSLIVFDLDHFSDVNNEHGHAVGDAVLRRVARAMASAVRTGDVVARYGGEEFVIIAPGASQDDAVRLAERIRIRVTHEAHDAIDGLVVPLTISAGVASRLGDETDGRGLFRAADSALLTAKRAGRDRVATV